MPDQEWITDLGPAQVRIGSWTVLKTHGGVKFRLADTTKETMYDQDGDTPYDETIIGRRVTVEVPVGLPSLQDLARMLPGSTLSDGNKSKSLSIKTGTGVSLRDLAAAAIIVPIINGVASTDRKLWVTIPLAGISPNFDYAYDLENQRVYTITLKGYADSAGVLAIMGVNSSS